MSETQHIAFIPARKGSVGFPGKNPLFFDRTADFLDSSDLFDQVIVSTNDEEIKEKSKSRNYQIHHRNEVLSGSAISIKQVAENVAEEMNLLANDCVWLLYIPVLYRHLNDFKKAKKLVEEKEIVSLCSFIRSEVHPFDCWTYDEKAMQLNQFIKNDAMRRQDKPVAWQHYHYLTCFRPKVLPKLNNELLCPDTYPLFLSQETAKKLAEIDTPEEYEEYKERNARSKELLNQ